MAGNLVEKDSSSVKDVQGPILTCGSKRRAGSSDVAGKKTKQQIDKDSRERKQRKIMSMKEENEKLKENNFRLEGRADQLEKDLKETRKENFSLKVSQETENKRRENLERVIRSWDVYVPHSLNYCYDSISSQFVKLSRS